MKNFTLKFVLTFVLGLGLAFAAEAQTVKGGVTDPNGDMIYYPDKNEFRGNVTLQAVMRDYRMSL